MHVRYRRSLPEGYLMYGCDYEQYDGVLHIPLSSFPLFHLASLHIMSFKSQKWPVHRNMLSSHLLRRCHLLAQSSSN